MVSTYFRVFLPSLLSVLAVSQGQDVFRFAKIYSDHMVLEQAPKRAVVWGYGEIGKKVLLQFSGQSYDSLITAHEQGNQSVGLWQVLLLPTTFGGPYQIVAHSTVKGKEKTINLMDVMFGDVWICSGQSNMEFTVVQVCMRSVLAGRDCESKPQHELKSVLLPWSRPSPETVGGKPWQYFSAVCWYYGVQLYEELKYPIGLIATSWGGTPIEAWSSPDALAQCGGDESILKTSNKRLHIGVGKDELQFGGPQKFSCLWNAMIVPFLNMTIHGSIWYQGEDNAQYHYLSYNCSFPAMVDDWRAKWYSSTRGNTDPVFPFGFVQLSSVGHDLKSTSQNFATLRWNQTAQFGYVPNPRQKNTFMAVAMDLGNPKSPYGSIHPTDKTDVGFRLGLAGLSIAYGKDKYYTGPLVSKIQKYVRGSTVYLQVFFKSLNKKIELRNSDGFQVQCKNVDTWKDAPVVDLGGSFVYLKTNSCEPVRVRYAWCDYPCVKLECAVYSGGLPSPPFLMNGPFDEIKARQTKNHFDFIYS
ncbi:sialate O-acetylesterase-like isoform X2 [Xenia sp. Carnegie-2017]|uniref:sialate O-acetylesterase-like isoform X2 n=1 Tax=Xenia sp. Carnegie-2017 TaxID=2897299 RepID=UPI001F0505CB|nr:sialate O-acetylesterase-like isoform X2 [Xenia sp. Carnegie-2017]